MSIHETGKMWAILLAVPHLRSLILNCVVGNDLHNFVQGCNKIIWIHALGVEVYCAL